MYDQWESVREITGAAEAIGRTHKRKAAVVVRHSTTEQFHTAEVSPNEQDRVLHFVNQLTKRSDISYRKLLEEMDKDPEALLVRQAILENKPELLPPWFRRFGGDLTGEIGLVYQGDRLLIPESLREWILQIVHGDHAGEAKGEGDC